MSSKNVIIIGSGFAGLSAACFMAKAGWKVTVLEKNEQPGGRARQLKIDGFSFDMGPSWYWMPEIFERFFNQFNKSDGDYYELTRLDPSYRIYWQTATADMPAAYEDIKDLFESIEFGSGNKLDLFLKEAAYKYRAGMHNMAYKPNLHLTELFDGDFFKGIFKLDMFTSISNHVKKYFNHPHIQQLLEFPVLFLGALPEEIPALYSLMNYADIRGGSWFPKGGMYSVVNALYKLALELGAEFHFNRNVTKIEFLNRHAKKVVVENTEKRVLVYDADVIISNADYHFTETKLLPPVLRNYTNRYWNKRKISPSCILYYVGLNKKLKKFPHHTLFFDTSFKLHANQIYKTKQWPTDPLFYVSATSVTDETLAPPGCENLCFLVPVAAGLTHDTEGVRDFYFDQIITRFETRTEQSIRDNIIVKKTFSVSDFEHDYNAYKGNAYGLANTILQTAFLRPSIKNKKVKNLFYTGQFTVPGPGVPPAIISGEIVAKHVIKNFG